MQNIQPPVGDTVLGLELYFPDRGDVNKIKQNTKAFTSHILRSQQFYQLPQIKKEKYFPLDYKYLMLDDQFCSEWPAFAEDLVNNTEFTLNCINLAMYQHLNIVDQNVMKKEIRCRLINYEPIQFIKEVNVTYLGKLVSLRGTVIKVSPVELVCDYMTFHCNACDTTQVLKQKDKCFTPLEKCQNCKLVKKFEPLYDSPGTKTVDIQNVVLQEIDGDVSKIPQSLKCELTDDLVKTCICGDDITITGIIKVVDPNGNKGKNKQNSVFNLYLQAVAVYNNNNESSNSPYAKIIFTPEDYSAIQKIHAQPNLFRYLVQSLCPTIFGHELVKAGLLLGLFGGTKQPTTRSESHILMVGDPGLGKSQMLKSCSNVSPRGVYVCGNVSTTSGLTVTMAREGGGEYSLEAGALVIADQGCCCIDEFDKMPTQHACLLEAMEQQTISIAKGGVVCSLPTKTTILAAANPVGGHYDKSKTVAENLKINSPMLSRFDLIFIILDQPNQQLDKYLTKHILTAHSAKKRKFTPKEFHFDPDGDDENEVNSLKQRLKLNGESLDYIPHKIFRKYLAFAQKSINPQLSRKAKETLIEFYVSLRKQFSVGDSTPVTARQLHSLIRLTQARAKAELREEATEADVNDVIEIMKFSLESIFTDSAGQLDRTRSQMGTGMSNKDKIIKMLEILQRRSEIESKSLFSLQDIKEAGDSVGLAKNKFNNALQSLNIQGFLLSKGRNNYQLNSAYL
ncbi:DNA helicase MCM8-like isoform X2 [Anthonomus grandis grandis]|uniref:DNA helicase MCM8-like isoform X2 n=1 Tax=Anthonomus grandis grandis TaxID=2921223 RepID=UPI002165BBE9|nr:DNA helicase MCM8-like isoform X2 [Anthonomus grandis grandis]